jgi:hypothetical protein
VYWQDTLLRKCQNALAPIPVSFLRRWQGQKDVLTRRETPYVKPFRAG